MQLYRITTTMLDTNTEILLHSSDVIIEAVSPAQSMRKHNLPRINENQIITIQITKCTKQGLGFLHKGPMHIIDHPAKSHLEALYLQSSDKVRKQMELTLPDLKQINKTKA